jgi:hypothetical protein
MKLFACFLLACSAAFAETPALADILARVAANQAKSVDARKEFVYREDELVRISQTNGKRLCEQRQQFTITPNPSGIERQLVERTQKEGAETHCTVNLSGNNGESLSMSTGEGSKNLSFSTSMGNTPDGMPRGMFPLTADEQRLYTYKLRKTENLRGRQVYRISFQPNGKRDPNGRQGYWKGEALIDTEEFQPVQVVTDLKGAVPLPVRVFLGTNVHGLGFSVSYERLADGVWFPSGFGGEFKVQALFFFRYVVSVNVHNTDFRRADVNSKVTYDPK